MDDWTIERRDSILKFLTSFKIAYDIAIAPYIEEFQKLNGIYPKSKQVIDGHNYRPFQ